MSSDINKEPEVEESIIEDITPDSLDFDDFDDLDQSTFMSENPCMSCPYFSAFSQDSFQDSFLEPNSSFETSEELGENDFRASSTQEDNTSHKYYHYHYHYFMPFPMG